VAAFTPSDKCCSLTSAQIASGDDQWSRNIFVIGRKLGALILLILRLLGQSSEMLSHQSGIDQGRSSAVSARGADERWRLEPKMHRIEAERVETIVGATSGEMQGLACTGTA